MSAQNSAGIQTLLDAEKEAQKIVQKAHAAREYRTKRVKEAKAEAQKEIEEYRKQKEDEFKKYEKEQTSGNEEAEKKAGEETETKLSEIEDIGKKQSDQVIEQLLRAVTEVNLDHWVPKNEQNGTSEEKTNSKKDSKKK